MNKLIDNLAVKIIAIFLMAIIFAVVCISGMGITYFIDEGFYDVDEYDFYESNACNNLNYQNADRAFNDYFLFSLNAGNNDWEQNQLRQNAEYFAPENSNFLFRIIDENNQTLFATYQNQEYGLCENFNSSNYVDINGNQYQVIAYVQKPLYPVDEYYQKAEKLTELFDWRYSLIIIFAISCLLCLTLLIYLLCAAGHKKGVQGISLNYQDKIPYDILLAILITAFTLPIYFISYSFYNIEDIIWASPLAVILMLLALDALMTTATRIKSGRLLRNTVCFYVLRGCWKLFIFICKKILAIISSIFSGVGDIIGSIPVLWKTLLAMGGYLFFNIILIVGIETSYNGGLWILVFLFFNAAAVILVCKIIMQFRELKDGGTKIAAGDINSHINTEKMYRDLKFHGENLNNISTGMAKAVEAKMKSERLKTELITNVSHDIKTPLTSIINYVDLLKKEDIQSPKANEYLDVLERQSAKLKKLTEDLVEASKASTGNININLQHTDVAELLNQTVAEYQEKLDAAKLTPVVNINCPYPYILADGRLLWRVFDNLLANVCKYSQENTRVYFNVNESMGNIIISLKNISREPLNISTEELMERFVRGDSSRATEGSGLGLSISLSLTELQHGKFSLQIDGDLFKAQLCFAHEKN